MMVSKLLLLAAALMWGAMAQTTSVMDLFLNADEGDSSTYRGSVISAAPDATTYLLARLPENCTEESFWRGPCSGPADVPDLTRTYVNGPSTYARYLTEADAFTWNAECKISGQNFDCVQTFSGPSAAQEGIETMVYMLETSSSLSEVTITAGLEKILAASTTTSASGSAQTAASASSGPSETGDSASATSVSSSASAPSTTASGAATGVTWNIALAALCGAAAALGLGL